MRRPLVPVLTLALLVGVLVAPSPAVAVMASGVSLAADASEVAQGSRATFSIGSPWKRFQAGDPVVVERLDGTAWTTVASVTLDSSGQASASVAVEVGVGRYRARKIATSRFAAARSSTVTVNVLRSGVKNVLRAVANTVTEGSAVTLDVERRFIQADGLSIRLDARRADGDWSALDRRRLQSGQTMRFTDEPAVGVTQYRVVREEAPFWGEDISNVVDVTTLRRSRLTLGSSPTGVRVGRAVEYRGTSTPVAPRAAVELQEQVDEEWVLLGRSTIAADGRFSFSMLHPSGRHRVRAVTTARGTVAGAESPVLSTQVSGPRSLAVRITGLPTTVRPKVVVWGPGSTRTLTKSTVISRATEGAWAVAGRRVASGTKVYEPVVRNQDVEIGRETSATVVVDYAVVLDTPAETKPLQVDGAAVDLSWNAANQDATASFVVPAGREVSIVTRGSEVQPWWLRISARDQSGATVPLTPDDQDRYTFVARTSGRYTIFVGSTTRSSATMRLNVTTPTTRRATLDGAPVRLSNEKRPGQEQRLLFRARADDVISYRLPQSGLLGRSRLVRASTGTLVTELSPGVWIAPSAGLYRLEFEPSSPVTGTDDVELYSTRLSRSAVDEPATVDFERPGEARALVVPITTDRPLVVGSRRQTLPTSAGVDLWMGDAAGRFVTQNFSNGRARLPSPTPGSHVVVVRSSPTATGSVVVGVSTTVRRAIGIDGGPMRLSAGGLPSRVVTGAFDARAGEYLQLRETQHDEGAVRVRFVEEESGLEIGSIGDGRSGVYRISRSGSYRLEYAPETGVSVERDVDLRLVPVVEVGPDSSTRVDLPGVDEGRRVTPRILRVTGVEGRPRLSVTATKSTLEPSYFRVASRDQRYETIVHSEKPRTTVRPTEDDDIELLVTSESKGSLTIGVHRAASSALVDGRPTRVSSDDTPGREVAGRLTAEAGDFLGYTVTNDKDWQVASTRLVDELTGEDVAEARPPESPGETPLWRIERAGSYLVVFEPRTMTPMSADVTLHRARAQHHELDGFGPVQVRIAEPGGLAVLGFEAWEGYDLVDMTVGPGRFVESDGTAGGADVSLRNLLGSVRVTDTPVTVTREIFSGDDVWLVVDARGTSTGQVTIETRRGSP